MTTARQPTTQRRELLRTAVRDGESGIGTLAERFGVSRSTIRRDLAELARDGHVIRTYGGALDSAHSLERTLREKDAAHAQEKDAVASAAAAQVRDGEVILLDAGTTTGHLARQLAACERDLTVVTNGLPVLLALADVPGIQLIVLGGRMRQPNEAILGPSAEHQLRHITPDRVFLGADGLCPERGLCSPSLEQAQFKHTMLTCGRAAYVLADHSKLNSAPFPYWTPLDQPHTLMVDDGAPEALQDYPDVPLRTLHRVRT